MPDEAPVSVVFPTIDITGLPALRERYLGHNVQEMEHHIRACVPDKTIEIVEAGCPIDFEIKTERCRIIHDCEGAITDIRFG
jgi:hypothetical protein